MRWKMLALVAARAGQTENEIVVVGRPCRLHNTKTVLAVFGRIIQSAEHLMLWRVEFNPALVALVSRIPRPLADW